MFIYNFQRHTCTLSKKKGHQRILWIPTRSVFQKQRNVPRKMHEKKTTKKKKKKKKTFIITKHFFRHEDAQNQNGLLLIDRKMGNTLRINEPPHDKTNKMACAPSEDSDQPGHPPSLIRVFAVRMKKSWVLSYPLSTAKTLIRLGGCPG